MAAGLIIHTCAPWDVGCLAKSAAQGAVHAFVNALGEGVIAALKFLSSFWLKVPSPELATGSGQGWSQSATIADLQGYLAPATAVIAIISFAVALGRMGLAGDLKGSQNVGRQLAAMVCATLAVSAVAQLLIQAGDAFSPWVIGRAGGGSPSEGLKKLLLVGVGTGQPAGSLGLWLILFLLCLLGAIVQCIFMVVRGAALIVLMVLLPSVAAGAASDEGWARLKKMFMLIVGFALYKPVAAIIYATGIRLLSTNTTGSADNDVQNAIYGLTIIVLAALALPSFIKFLLPMAAMGSSGTFSGGAALGAAAAGAAIVATGGGGAVAASGTSAGGAAKGAGTAGAAAGSAGGGGAAGGGGPASGSGGSPGPGPGGGGESPAGGSSGGGVDLSKDSGDSASDEDGSGSAGSGSDSGGSSGAGSGQVAGQSDSGSGQFDSGGSSGAGGGQSDSGAGAVSGASGTAPGESAGQGDSAGGQSDSGGSSGAAGSPGSGRGESAGSGDLGGAQDSVASGAEQSARPAEESSGGSDGGGSRGARQVAAQAASGTAGSVTRQMRDAGEEAAAPDGAEGAGQS